jgi:penicillin-insensitive murein endopeptidase
MRPATIPALTIAALLLAAAPAAAADEVPAKILFSKADGPAPLAARSIGFYSRGCVAGARALAVDGPEWQVMRLSRNRYWGMPELVAYIERLAKDVRALDGWPGLLVGDLGQPRGGPTPTGHTSHQTGLDVDIWFEPMPDRTLSAEEREKIGARSVLVAGTHVELDMKKWPEGLDRVLKRAAGYEEVERIFVNPGVKKLLCERAGDDRAWLRKIRPWYKHDDHFHVRLRCPPGIQGCRAQDAVPAGDGCGENLAYWLGPEPWKPPPKPKKPPPPPKEITLADLPAACTEILNAGSGVAATPDAPPLPPVRPASTN